MIFIGYARTSKPNQKIKRQISNLKKYNPKIIIFQESYSSKTLQRPQFQKMLKFVHQELKKRNEITIVFDSVSRMSRDAQEGSELYFELESKNINLVFLNEPHINTEAFRSALELSLLQTGDEIVEAILEGVKKALWIKAKKDIELAFKQAEKELLDNRIRTKQGIKEAEAAGKRIGTQKGDSWITKRGIEIQEKLLKHSRAFNGSMTDKEFIEAFNVSKTTVVKYKKRLREI